MIAEIISVGTEITSGDTLDTNSHFISSKLLDIGIEAYYHTSVDDCPTRLENIIHLALDRSDLLIITGGLGPTKDDLTKEIVAKALGLELKLDKNMRDKIKKLFTSRGREMTCNNIKQAYKPLGAKFIDNHIGTAPGIYIEDNNKVIIMMPGPPREMRPMYEKEVSGLLEERFNRDISIIRKSINIVGIGESYLETELIDMGLEKENISITTFAGHGTVEIKIIGKGKDKEKIEKEVDLVTDKIRKRFKNYIYSYNNRPLEESLLSLLKEKQCKLGLCESCTGGLISSKITNIAGSSQILDRSIVSYSNRSKIEELEVSPDTLERYGAVSRQTAYEMAKGLLAKTQGVDLVLSITGIAGPSIGNNPNKEVGLVYICIMDRFRHEVIESKFNGDRPYIKERAAIKSLSIIKEFLLNYY